MLKTLRILGFATVFALAASAQTREKRVLPVDAGWRVAFERQVRIALLVGVGNYPASSGLGALKYPGRDVAALGAELERQGYLVRRLVDTEATRGVVRRSLNELAAALDPDQGTFLFYFSGHGFQQEGVNYLATFGSTADDLKGEGLAVSEVEAILKGSRARQTTMFIDACRNDPTPGARAVGPRTFADFASAQGLRTLYSTRSGRVSYESDELRQGVFTHFLVRGLQGEAAGSDGLVTFRDLADYVTDQVRAWGVKSGQVQVPYEAGESSGDFLLARTLGERLPVAVAEIVSGKTPEDLRLANGVRALQPLEDSKRFDSLPGGVYGFTVPWVLNTEASGSRLERAGLRRVAGGTAVMEIEKRASGEIYVVGYVSENSGLESTMFFGPYREFTRVVAIPLSRIKAWNFRSVEGHYAGVFSIR